MRQWLNSKYLSLVPVNDFHIRLVFLNVYFLQLMMAMMSWCWLVVKLRNSIRDYLFGLLFGISQFLTSKSSMSPCSRCHFLFQGRTGRRGTLLQRRVSIAPNTIHKMSINSTSSPPGTKLLSLSMLLRHSFNRCQICWNLTNIWDIYIRETHKYLLLRQTWYRYKTDMEFSSYFVFCIEIQGQVVQKSKWRTLE